MSFALSTKRDNIVLATKNGEQIIRWHEVVTVNLFDKYLIIRLLDNSTLIIPGRAYNDEKSFEECFQSIQNGILKTRGKLKVPLFLQPPYLLGVFCFVPA